jgi:RNA polymerase sigma factor (sigma-70 family)
LSVMPALPRPDDEEDLVDLLAAVARADNVAYRALYDRTSAKLFGLVLRIVKDRAVAEEILQDVYLRIWRNASTYSSEIARPMTWMITIARNRAIDVTRAKRDVTLAPREDGSDWLDAIADPRDEAGEVIDRGSLNRCLEILDEDQRRCIVAAYCEGYSREELALRHDRPVNTIKTWLHRGLTALRNCLGAP